MTYKEVISHLRNEIVNATGTLAALPPKAAEISSLNYHINALDIAIKALKKDRWIPVSDRLPENDGTEFETLLISTTEDGVQMGFYDDEDGTWNLTCSDGSAWPVIATAWMALPEPYREEKK